MRIKDGFVLRRLPSGNTNLVMPAGEKINTFKGALMLNETGAYIFEKIQQGMSLKEVSEALVSEYDISSELAEEDITRVFDELVKIGVAEK